MTMKPTTRARKSIEVRLQEMRARLEGLEKRKAAQEKRDLQRLKLRLGAAAVAAGFTADWTDGQVERAMAAAVKTREGHTRPQAAPKPDPDAGKSGAPAAAAAPKPTAGPQRG